MKKFTIIAAMDQNRGIGRNGQLPWRLRGDMDFFRTTTLGSGVVGRRNAVVMGHRTWDSLPPRFRPLPGRLNVVMTHRMLKLPKDVVLGHSLDEVLTVLDRPEVGEVFVIGGATVYDTAIQSPACERLLITEIQGRFPCDVRFPVIPSTFLESGRSDYLVENGIKYQFVTYRPD